MIDQSALPGLADATLLWLDQYQRGTIDVTLGAGELPQRIGRLSTILSTGFRQPLREASA